MTGLCEGGGLAFTPSAPTTTGSSRSRLSPHRPSHHRRRTQPETRRAQARGAVLVAGAVQDPGCPPKMAAELEQQLTAAGVEHTVTVNPEALYRCAQPHFLAYDETAAARHWREFVGLLDSSRKLADIAAVIKAARQDAGLSQSELAQRLAFSRDYMITTSGGSEPSNRLRATAPA